MKELVFATGNQAKIARFFDKLQKEDIKLESIKELNIELDCEENGKNAVENALIKARCCHEKCKNAVMGMDDTLYMEGVPEDKQPGLFVRRVNGKTLNDEEMIEHYKNLVDEYGQDGKINCKWIYGLAIIDEKGKESTYTWEKADFYMVNKVSDKINPGYPLNSISKYKKLDKYFTDITEEEKERIKVDESDVINFIKNHI